LPFLNKIIMATFFQNKNGKDHIYGANLYNKLSG
jgi:hypothetical protein